MSDWTIGLFAVLGALTPALISIAIVEVRLWRARRRFRRAESEWLDRIALDYFEMLRRPGESTASFRARVRGRFRAGSDTGTLTGVRLAAGGVPGVRRVIAVNGTGPSVLVHVEVDPMWDPFRVRAHVANACFDVAPAGRTVTVWSEDP